jgi:ADP-sugar diphosphatase
MASLLHMAPDLIDDFKLFLPQCASLYDAQKRAETVETAMYPSVGACDEFIPLFLCQKRLTRRHMEWLRGKATGLHDEGENITLKLVPLTHAWREGARDAKALAALALYYNLQTECLLPPMPAAPEREPEELKHVEMHL